MTIRKIIKPYSLLTSLTFMGYGFAFLKNILLAAYFGATHTTDAYFIANNIPEMLTYGIIGAIYLTVIPFYNDYRVNQGDKEANQIIISFINRIGIFTSGIIVIINIFPFNILKLLAPGLSPESLNLSVRIFRLLSLSILPTVMIGILPAIFNAHHRYLLSGIANLLPHFLVIVFMFYFSSRLHIYSLPLGFLIGGLIAFFILFKGMGSIFPYQFSLKMEREKFLSLLKAGLPILVGAWIIKGNLLVDRLMASKLGSGSISLLHYGNTLINVFHSLLVATLVIPVYSCLSASFANGRREEFHSLIRKSLRIAIFIFIPLSITLMIARAPLIKIIFEHGIMKTEDTLRISQILLYYLIGLFPFALISILYRALFALKKMSIYLLLCLLSFILNIIFNIIFIKYFGLKGIALSTSMVYIFISVILLGIVSLYTKTSLVKELVFIGMIMLVSLVVGYCLSGSYLL